MDVARLLASAPDTLRHSTRRPDRSYTLADDLVAVHAPAGAGPAALGHERGSISIEPAGGPRAAALDDAAVGPVYRHGPAGELAVPTGRALVRFAAGESAQRHRDELAGAGFELEEVPSYAPQAGWVRASSGRIADTLAQLPRLERISGVENVEPQLIGEASRR